MSATMKAAVHLGQDYQENLRTIKNTDFVNVKQLFDPPKKLILTQKDEIFGISTIDWNAIPWMKTTLLHDSTVKLSKAKVHGYSDSVLCLGDIHEYPQSIEAWKQKIEWFMKSLEYRELDRTDREPVEFEWKKSQDTQHCSCFVRSKGRWKRTGFYLKSSKIESSSCRCTTTSLGEKQKL